MHEPDRCAICGHTDKRDLGTSLAHWKVSLPGMAYEHVLACRDREACRARVQAQGNIWPSLPTQRTSAVPPKLGQKYKHKPLADRLWAKVDTSAGPTGCWPFNGYRSAFGYGRIRTGPLGTPKIAAHRAAYELLVGPVPDGHQLDHLCRNPPCCNPAHLEPVTALENTMRSPIAPAAVNARRTHCKHGHPFDESNTAFYFWAGRRHRKCRTCSGLVETANDHRRSA